jgi:DUF4097 and DUF4098 domain-containing protein YvlB
MKVVSSILTLLLCISFLSTVYARAEEFSFELEKVFEVGKTENLIKLSNSSGEITIESYNQDKIIVHATKVVRAKDQKEANEIAERIGIDINKTDSTITIETEYPKIKPKGFWSNFLRFDWGDRAWVDYHILVPTKTKLDIRSASADVNVRGIENQVNVWVASGDVLLENIIGDVNANSASGNLEVYGAQGRINLKGASSDIKIRRTKGSMNLTTASGDIYGEKIEGNLSISQASGDLELYEINGDITAKGASGDKKIEQKQGSLNLNSSSGDIEAKTDILPNKEYFMESASGDVKLYIPSQSKADIELRTASGNIDCKIPMELRIASAKKIEGKANQGGSQIQIETTSGDIFLFSQ